MTSKRKRHIYNAIGISLSALFLYLCFHSLDRAALKQAFALPYPWFLMGVVILNFVLMVFRTQIWNVLLRPTKDIPYWTLFDLLHIGYMANNLLPLKAGEFFRASFVAKKWKLPYTQVLTTIGLERYFYGFSLILVFFWVTVFLQVPVWIKSGAYVVAAVLIGVQVSLTILWKTKPNLEKWEKRHPLIYRGIEILFHIGEGSQPLKSGKSFFNLLFLGLITWVIQAVMLKIIEMGYGLDLSWSSTLFVMVAINLGTALPSAPGNLGTLELAAVLGYTFVGLDKATALGIGIYFHFLQAIPITFVGLFYYFRWGLRFRDMEKVAEEKFGETIS